MSHRFQSRARRRALALALSVALTASACATNLGPRTLGPARFDYNQALADSWNQQMLLNLVRLRYRDTPVFLEVGTLLAQYSIGGSGSLGASIDGGGGDNSYGLGAGVDFSESPTITFSPLQGEAFVRRLLTPISPATVLLLSQAGWSIERLMLCCVQGLNGMPNAPSAAGPTPDYRPRFEPFHRLAYLLRELQVRGYFKFQIDRTGEEERFFVRVTRTDDPQIDAMGAEVAEILGLDRERSEYTLVDETAPGTGDLLMAGRSLLGVLFYLSQGVAVPPSHVEAGWVTDTREEDGRPFDWDQLTGRLFRVSESASRPAEAFVAVPYRGHWFYIADTDLNSKTTFSLLTLLFSLQASGGGGASPLLTVATGG